MESVAVLIGAGLAVTHAGVGEPVGQVDGQVDAAIEERVEDQETLHQGIVTPQDGIDGKTSDSGDVEHSLRAKLVEQEVGPVFRMASRNYVLSQGRILAEGTAASLMADETLRAGYLGL